MAVPPDHVSLLRTEALERARDLRDIQMLVELDLTGSGATFASRTTITFDAAPGSTTFVDLQASRLRTALLNGRELAADSWVRGRIPLAGLQSHNVLVIDAEMAYSNDGEGLHRHVDPVDQQTYLYAMSFLDAAPRWFACFDQPDLKASYELKVTVPPGWSVIGNGPSVKCAPGEWRIVPTRPLSTYFVTLVAGPYATVTDEHDGIPLGFHVRASLGEALLAEADDLIAVTKASFDYFHRVFGLRYPFGEYHQAIVPDFNAGAMENPGCVTLRDQYIYRARATSSERGSRAGTIAHEMAHMWFGDLVTMKWWSDLWLNESFAEYMAHRACAESTDYPLWTEFGIIRKDWGAVADQSASTHPVAGDGSIDAQSALQDFDGISYAKGAAVLKQLVAYLGDDVFFAGLGRYFEQHAFANAEFADLIAAWTASGATELDEWAAAWLRTVGMDTIGVESGHRSAVITCSPPAGQSVARTHALQIGAVEVDGRLFARSEIKLAQTPVVIEVPAETILLIPDASDETWAKIRFGAGGWRAVDAVLSKISDPTPRVVIYNSIRDAVRDAELSTAEALDLICSHIVKESSDVVLKAMLQFAQDQLAGSFASPDTRTVRRRRISRAARAVLDQNHPGSDLQLAAFRILIRSSDDADELQSWLESSRLPPGVRLDPELVWAIVERLSSLTGKAQLIDSTLSRDPSAAGQVHAARARAGLPTEEAKEAAWQLIVRPSSASAYEVYATANGFFDPAQTELTQPYVARYFDEIPGTATFRSGWVLGEAAKLAFPASAASRETLALAEGVLARPDLAAPIRRSLVDGSDRLRRAIASLVMIC
jgi:aminopeptidase N